MIMAMQVGRRKLWEDGEAMFFVCGGEELCEGSYMRLRCRCM